MQSLRTAKPEDELDYRELRSRITPSGGGERLLTNDWQDEAPTWSPNGRVLQFFRTSRGASGKSSLWQVDLTGVNMRRLPTPGDGSDPSWGPIRP